MRWKSRVNMEADTSNPKYNSRPIVYKCIVSGAKSILSGMKNVKPVGYRLIR